MNLRSPQVLLSRIMVSRRGLATPKHEGGSSADLRNFFGPWLVLGVSLSVGCGSLPVGQADIGVPQIPRTSNTVGAYYWVAWDTKAVLTNMMDWRDATVEPLLGRYDSTDVNVVNWQIKTAVENGITFFAVDFWENQLTGFLRASYLKYIKYCFIAPIDLSVDNANRHFEQQIPWLEKYIDPSRYFTINGRPVVFIIIDLKEGSKTAEEEATLVRMMSLMKKATTMRNLYYIGAYSNIGDGNYSKSYELRIPLKSATCSEIESHFPTQPIRSPRQCHGGFIRSTLPSFFHHESVS